MNANRDQKSYKGSSGKRAPRAWELTEWQVTDPESYRLARLVNLTLGRLPQRLAKFGKAPFDPEEDRGYGIGHGEKTAGRDLAGLAAYLVRCAPKHPIDYLKSLRGIPAAIIEPIKTYMRVKLAVGRLEAEIAAAKRIAALSDQDKPPNFPRPESDIPKPAQPTSGPLQEQVNKQAPKPKSFTWDVAPVKAYGFKEMTAAYGYDPRDTSAYWIEKRAQALRRKWRTHRLGKTGESRAAFESPASDAGGRAPVTECDIQPDIRYFEPADADYNAVWPPLKLPDAPPKIPSTQCQRLAPRPAVISEFSPENNRDLAGAYDVSELAGSGDAANSAACLPMPLPSKLICARAVLKTRAENSEIAERVDGDFDLLEAENAVISSETIQNTAPISPQFQCIRDAAIAARKAADEAGQGLSPPSNYYLMFGRDLVAEEVEMPSNIERRRSDSDG